MDDFVLQAGKVLDDDLVVVVTARANSVSRTTDMGDLPGLLHRYFANNNLLLIYPSQFGEAVHLPSFTDPLQSDISTTLPGWWRMLWRRIAPR